MEVNGINITVLSLLLYRHQGSQCRLKSLMRVRPTLWEGNPDNKKHKRTERLSVPQLNSRWCNKTTIRNQKAVGHGSPIMTLSICYWTNMIVHLLFYLVFKILIMAFGLLPCCLARTYSRHYLSLSQAKWPCTWVWSTFHGASKLYTDSQVIMSRSLATRGNPTS